MHIKDSRREECFSNRTSDAGMVEFAVRKPLSRFPKPQFKVVVIMKDSSFDRESIRLIIGTNGQHHSRQYVSRGACSSIQRQNHKAVRMLRTFREPHHPVRALLAGLEERGIVPSLMKIFNELSRIFSHYSAYGTVVGCLLQVFQTTVVWKAQSSLICARIRDSRALLVLQLPIPESDP